jgi:FOG: WD40 repeat
MEKLKIFISGTQDDMKPERDAVDRGVSSTMLSTGIRAETAVSQPQSPHAWIEQQLRECNIYIGVYSHRYGWVIPDEGVSATEFEFNLARKLGKPILVWIRRLRDEEKSKPNIDRQEQFLNRVSDFSTGHLRQEFDTPADLEKWVTAALGETFTEIIRRGTAPNTSKFLVPFPHNPDFVGREAELSSLHEMLQKGQSIVGIRPTVLVGLGGIGKTQLAVEYAHAHRDDYPSGVFWLNAINPLLIEFSDLAEKLEMADRNTPRDNAARGAWDYLDSHPDSLVIFDNVLEPAELNVPFSPDLIPANLRCRTLFTTRQRDFPRNFQPFEVKVLPGMAAMRLLLRSRPEVLEEHHPEWGWARIVCASLGWLPLALELAAAYLGAYPEVSITDYLERLRNEGSLETVDDSEVRAVDLPTRVEEILKAAASGNLEQKHQIAVSATLQTQWNRVEDKDARLFFRAAGQFPEASWIPISRLGLLTGIETEAKLGRPSPLNVALKKLHAVSLIEELTEDRLRLHPLVQEFAARLSPTSFRIELAKQVAIALYDFSRLQTHVVRYGIYAVLEDVRTGLRLIADPAHDVIYHQLSNLDRALDRLAHDLPGWDPEIRPSFMLQELYNEAALLGLNEIRLYAEKTLAEKKLQYLIYKSTSHEESQELLRTLAGHTSEVLSVAMSADGKMAISGAEDNTLIVWNVEKGIKLHTLQCVAHEPSPWVMDGGQGVGISGDLMRVDMNHNSVAISADGRLALSVSSYRANQRAPESANGIVWDVKTGQQLRRFFSSRAVLIAEGKLAYSEEDIKVEYNQEPKPPRIQVLDITTGLEVSDPIYLSEEYIKTIDNIQSADGKLTISSKERSVKVLRWKFKAFESDKDGSLYRIAMSADGKFAVSAMPDDTMKVWDVTSGRELCVLAGHLAKINDVAMSPDGQTVISASSDKTLKVWDISIKINNFIKESNANKPINDQAQSQSHKSAVNSVAISADGFLAISASSDTIKVWDVLNATQLNELSTSSIVHRMAVSKRLAILATHDKNIKVLNIRTGQELDNLQAHDNWVTGVSISADEQTMVSASSDKTLKTWKLSISSNGDFLTCRKLQTLQGHTKDVVDVALSANGRLAVSASMDYTLKVWDIAKGKELHTIQGPSELRNVALSADGQIAISTAVRDTRIRVWNVTTGQETHSLRAHKLGVSGIALSANGSLAASTSSEDKILNIWNVTTKQIIATFRSNVSLNCCAMSADGTSILAGDAYGGIHFLKLVGTDEIQALE